MKERIAMWSIVLVLIVAILLMQKCNKTLVETNEIYQHLLDTTIKYKDKYGVEHTTNTILSASHANLLLALKSSDSMVIELQNRVRAFKNDLKDGGSVTIIHSVDSVEKVTKTDVSFPLKDSCNPTYSTKHLDKWLHYTISSNKDSTIFQLETFHDYSVVIGSKRPKWYKKKETFVDISDQNPYSSVKNLKAFEIKDKSKPRFSFGIQAGYGLTLKGFQPYIGIGGQFKLFEL